MAGLKEILEGRPFRGPLHPALVHLPLALFPLSVLLDAASWLFRNAAADAGLVRLAFWALLGGLVTALFAAVFGFVDYTTIRDDHPAKKVATLHMILNLLAVGVFGGSAGLRWGELGATRTPGVAFVVSLVGLVLLGYSGYLGGHLVYSDGVAVGRHRRGTRLPERTIIASVRERAGWAEVADDAALREGETLRVNVAGMILVVVRTREGLHAVQEFCPHRYGPLSEGAVRGCEIECPWHGSRFDLRTGKVTHGPAKVDVRTFPAELRDGKIWVRLADGNAARALAPN